MISVVKRHSFTKSKPFTKAPGEEAARVKNQAYRMAMLFDFYGDILTPRQREFYDLYYNEDLSLAEIAENYGITRQGVRDVIVRAEAAMTELEDKTGIIRRFHKMREQLGELEGALSEARRLSERRGQDEDLERQFARMQEILSQLKQE